MHKKFKTYIKISLLIAIFSINKLTANFHLPLIPLNTEAKTSSENMTFIDEKGQIVSLTDLKGKVIFINFWATWCKPCVDEMPTIQILKEKFNNNDDIVFIMLNIEADFEKSVNFMKSKNFDLPVYAAASAIPPIYFQNAVPTTLIFDKEGNLAARLQGALDFSNPDIYEALNELTLNN